MSAVHQISQQINMEDAVRKKRAALPKELLNNTLGMKTDNTDRVNMAKKSNSLERALEEELAEVEKILKMRVE